MAEIFKEAQAFNNHPNRWNHDLSKKIYASFKMGVVYPVLTQMMTPTDSARLDIASLLQFMPTATPLQSNVRVIYHVFFQRMKNIWKDFPNFIEMLEEHDAPYIRPSVHELKPGSIHDFLGVNVCVVKHGSEDLPMRYYFGAAFGSDPSDGLVGVKPTGNFNAVSHYPYTVGVSTTNGILIMDSGSKVAPAMSDDFFGSNNNFLISLDGYPFSTDGDVALLPNKVVMRLCLTDDFGPWRNSSVRWVNIEAGANSLVNASPYLILFDSAAVRSALDTLGWDGSQYIHFDLAFYWLNQSGSITLDKNSDPVIINRTRYSILKGGATCNYFISNSYSYDDFPHLCPYCTLENPEGPIKLKAYRHRVYESLYNAFYRNINGNQPFLVDGVPQYNKYNTTNESGLDRTNYHLFYRNWELDAFTSCLSSPQQGNPPLVGVTSTGRLTIEDDDGTRSTAQLQDLPDGQQGLSVSEVNAANDTHRSIIMNLASSGITINDLRETNALQKFLETNIRKGFRYIDFILGHFGKAPKHAEMDMPEFIGGFTVKLDVGKVTNTNAAASASNENDVLGQFAGSAQAFGSSKHSMSYYADDYGYLMVTQCIVPDSSYSQVLPKDFLYSEPLDFPFPEFSNLSYQPITYEEFCPGECYKEMVMEGSGTTKRLTDVFGYQRPQHELVWNPDTLHGQFLTTMNNYVISRFFDGRPELGDDFLTIKPEETQNVFTVVKADNDIAFGQVAFKLSMKRPYPRIVLPSIGR